MSKANPTQVLIMTIIQVRDELEPSQHRAGSQALGEGQVIFLENLGTTQSPSHAEIRILSRKLEHTWGRSGVRFLGLVVLRLDLAKRQKPN